MQTWPTQNFALSPRASSVEVPCYSTLEGSATRSTNAVKSEYTGDAAPERPSAVALPWCEVGSSFNRRRHNHLEAHVPGVYNATEARANIQTTALADVFKPAAEIVDDELTTVFSRDTNVPCDAFPNADVLARAANRAHQRLLLGNYILRSKMASNIKTFRQHIMWYFCWTPSTMAHQMQTALCSRY